MSRFKKNDRMQRKPRNLKGIYRRVVMKRSLLERLREFIMDRPVQSYLYEGMNDPYGNELDRAWEEFEKNKIV